MQPIVTFLSDFGTGDAYVAQVKAVILSGLPGAAIVDITHEIRPFDILSAAWTLHTTYRYFPEGTCHLAVVDPGVGTSRDVLAVRKGRHIFIGPDNGIFSFLYPADEVIEVLWRPDAPVSPTFHGRDVFAPVLVKAALGADPGSLGRIKTDPVRMDVHAPMVVAIDRFGNIITNVESSHLKEGFSLTIGDIRIQGIADTYADLPRGEMGLIRSSTSTIEIAMYQGNAAQALDVRVGTPVVIS
jgi:S-adenosylmethionine hydrolase